jgi:hypothetical protein
LAGSGPLTAAMVAHKLSAEPSQLHYAVGIPRQWR